MEVIYRHAINCLSLLLSDQRCEHCSKIASAISQKRKIPVEATEISTSQIFSLQLSRSDWTPFMQSYFQQAATRKKTSRWQLHVLMFAVGFFCRSGKAAYRYLRENFNLPSVEVLKRIIQRLDCGPGLNHTALRSFMGQNHNNGMVLAFDEIYFEAGLKLIKNGDSLHTIGFHCYGQWKASDPDQLNQFVFISPEDLAGFDCDSEVYLRVTSTTSTMTGPEIDPVDSQPARGWCTDGEAEAFLAMQTQNHQNAKMALHFMLTTPSSAAAQGIGYVECVSVTWEHLRALIYRIIAACNQHRNSMSTEANPTDPLPTDLHQPPPKNLLKKNRKKKRTIDISKSATHTSTVENDSWSPFTRFHQRMGLEGVDFLSLVPNPLVFSPWAREESETTTITPEISAPTPSMDLRNRIVAICFDGSSHARAFVRRVSQDGIGGFRYSIHPSQPGVEIIMLSDIVHLFKRYRNNMLRDRIFIAPKPAERPPGQPLQSFLLSVNKKLYKELVETDHHSILSVSRVAAAAIDPSSRTKQSFPLAKQLLNPRTQIIFQMLENQALQASNHPRVHLMKVAKTVSDFGFRLLSRTRSRWVLNTLEHRRNACQQLLQLKLEFHEWKKRNDAFYNELKNEDRARGLMGTEFTFPDQRGDCLGFFDRNFEFDLCFTLAGLARLCMNLNEICLRLLTSDSVESLFSTIRAVAGGGGQLNIASHRSATRRAYILRLNMFGYIGEGIARNQALATYLANVAKSARAQAATPQIILPSLTFIQSTEITPEERCIIRYISGWMLHLLLKKFTDEKLGNLIECFTGRLIRAIPRFDGFIERLIIQIHAVLHHNQEHQMTHETLVDYLRRNFRSDFSSDFSNFDEEVFELIIRKVASMFLADKLRRKKIYGSKSFRNGLN